jgi:hypothetical protein
MTPLPKTLFDFRFKADLGAHRIGLLREATGMRISDADNMWKDTPGKGTITPGVRIFLARPSGEPNDWQIEAFTHEDDYDSAAVEACRQRLRRLLPQISETWKENTR